VACKTCGYPKGHMGGCPEGQSSGGQGRDKKRRTGGTCTCNCGHRAGEVINGVKQKWGGGCLGAKAGDPHAAHCGRPKCRGD
jgi:hypothetical protein